MGTAITGFGSESSDTGFASESSDFLFYFITFLFCYSIIKEFTFTISNYKLFSLFSFSW